MSEKMKNDITMPLVFYQIVEMVFLFFGLRQLMVWFYPQGLNWEGYSVIAFWTILLQPAICGGLERIYDNSKGKAVFKLYFVMLLPCFLVLGIAKGGLYNLFNSTALFSLCIDRNYWHPCCYSVVMVYRCYGEGSY